MDFEKAKKLNIKKGPGCYQFLDKSSNILYIGKAANLKGRVLSYFSKSTGHSPAKYSMLKKVDKIKVIETDSEIEALLLEANLIKKHQPPYNVVMRDDKRYQYIKITDDELPRVITTRNIDKAGRYFGPFTSGTAVRETIKAIRKIFPYGGFITLPAGKVSEKRIKRYPELYERAEDKKEYKKIINQITTFLEGGSKKIVRSLEKQIKKEKDEKKAASLKYQLLNMKNVLAHANVLSIYDKYAADVIELAKILNLPMVPKRIEGYDISNIFGKYSVGSMVVFKNGESDKNEYRKFKIKTVLGANDTAMLKEILARRFKNDWAHPDLIIIDGGKAQLNASLAVLKKIKLDIPIISISKGEGLRSAKARDKIFFPGEKKPLELPLASPALHIIKRVRDEAHRFAISYHRQKRKIKNDARSARTSII